MAVVTARYHPPRVTSGGAGEHRRYGERMSPVTSPRVVLQGASRDNLVRELLAGVTLVAIALPLNIGYAQIAGLPPETGLYALVLPTLIYVFVVSSRQVVVAPDAAATALVASSVGGLAAAGSEAYLFMAMAQAILCGVLLLAMARFRLGYLANFLSEPILVGFVGGLALDILVSQVAKMLGLHLEHGHEFIGKVVELVRGLPEVHVWSVVISAVALLVLVLGQRIAPRVPWALAVLVGSTLVVQHTRIADSGISLLGEVPSGAPSLSWPSLGWTEWLALIPSAVALTAVIAVEGLLVSRSYAEKHGYPMDADRDLAAFGLANIASGVSGSFTVGSSTSRTAAMDQAGSRSQLPSLVMAAIALILLMFGTALLEGIPSPAIGAIVAIAVWPLLGIRALRQILRLDRFEFAIGATCFAVTVLVGPIIGIVVAFVLSVVNIARRAANPPIQVLAAPTAQDQGEADASAAPGTARMSVADGPVSAPGVLVVRVAAPLFFGNADAFATRARQLVGDAGEVDHFVLDLEAVTDVDITAAAALTRLREWLAEQEIDLSFSRVRVQDRARLGHLGVMLEGDRVFESNHHAVAELAKTE